MQKIKKFIIVSMFLITPVFAFADLIPCNGTTTDCNFNAFITLINNVINFIFKGMAIPIAAVMFFYAGFLMVTSAGSSESKTKAKNIFSNAVIGLAIAAGAWIIIKTILTVLGYKGGLMGF